MGLFNLIIFGIKLVTNKINGTRWLCYFNSESERKKKTTLRVSYEYEGDRYMTVFNGGSFLTRPVEIADMLAEKSMLYTVFYIQRLILTFSV